MSMMVSFVLSFFPRDVLDEILNLIESVSEDFLTTLKFHEVPLYCCLVMTQFVDIKAIIMMIHIYCKFH